MTTVLVLFVAGVLLVAVEILVPGGVLGLLGGLCLLGGVVSAFLQLGPVGGAIATGGCAADRRADALLRACPAAQDAAGAEVFHD